MKFTTNAKTLSDALAKIGRIVATRNTYPILANVLITASPDGVELRATDLDIEITLGIDADVAEPGRTTVPARTAADIARKLGSNDVTFSADSETATVQSGRSRFQLQVLAVDGFPDLKTGDFATRFTAPGKFLAEAFAKVQFAISTEETRYYLNGVYVHAPDEGEIRFVATDGHRLAKLVRPLDGVCGMPAVIVPKKTVAEVIKLFGDAEDVDVQVSETKMRFTAGRVVLLTKLIEGTFPDYERVTPKNNNTVAICDRKTLITIADRVSTIASDRGGKAVKLAFDAGNLKLEVTNPDHGVAEDEMEISFDADPIEIGYNARYLGDILGIVQGENVSIHLHDAGSPTLITSDGDVGFASVLMPMRV